MSSVRSDSWIASVDIGSISSSTKFWVIVRGILCLITMRESTKELAPRSVASDRYNEASDRKMQKK